MRTEVGTRRVQGHSITWWVYPTGTGRQEGRVRHAGNMRGFVAWDATCQCGWDSRTGGAVRSSVEREVRDHKFDATGDWRVL